MTMSVTLAVSPKGAKVVRVGATDNLNASSASSARSAKGAPNGMVELQVLQSSPAWIEVSSPGYKTVSLAVDGRSPVLRIDLERDAVKVVPQPSNKPPPKQKCKPGEELCDPFG